MNLRYRHKEGGAMSFFTIAIPTYNRMNDLKNNLENIYAEIGDSEEVEVVVSDNASSDGTKDVLIDYARRHNNFRYAINSENIGASRNIIKVIDLASGDYCMLHGDDDMYLPGAIGSIIDNIKKDLECAVYFYSIGKNDAYYKVSEGINAFLKQVSYTALAISRIIINKKVYTLITEKNRFIDSMIPHIYLIYRLISINPKYMCFYGRFLKQSGAATTAYNYGEVYMNNYFQILEFFMQYGLNESYIKNEKHRILTRFIVPYYLKRKDTPVAIKMQDVVHCYIQNYKDEPYFEEYYKVLLDIQKQYKW